MGRLIAGLVALCCVVPLRAQEPVARVPDVASYATAAVNPAVAVYKAIRSDQPWCHLAQFGVSELIGNGSTFGLKKAIVSARPCAGCAPDGMPSGHSMNSVIGVSSNWRVGIYFSLGTAQLRQEAHRHTPWQTVAGLALGGASEWAGQRLVRCR